jgi:hypothetical protein
MRNGSNENLSYEMKYNGTVSISAQQMSSIYEFQTDLITLRLETCDGTPIDGGHVRWGHGSNFGTSHFVGGNTGSSTTGETTAELFPGIYSFEMGLSGTVDYKMSYDFPTDGATLVWKTTNVSFAYAGSISFGGPTGDSRWFVKPSMELMPGGTYVFHFRGAERVDITIPEPCSEIAVIQTMVFDDRNCDKLCTNEENFGIAGVTVHLTENDGTIIDTKVTGANGFTVFNNVPTGRRLRLEFIAPPDYHHGGCTGKITDLNNSDVFMSGKTRAFTVKQGDVLNYIDCGMWAPGTLTTLVWHDINNDGYLDGEENLGIAGVTVTLCELDKSPYATAVTGSDGKATFNYVPADRPFKLSYGQLNGYVYPETTHNDILAQNNNDANFVGVTDGFSIAKGSEHITYVNAGVITINNSPSKTATLNSEVGLTIYPNPVSISAVIDYTLAEESAVDIAVYNLAGQEVAKLVAGERQTGRHILEWDVSTVENGMYIVRYVYNNKVEFTRIVVAR